MKSIMIEKFFRKTTSVFLVFMMVFAAICSAEGKSEAAAKGIVVSSVKVVNVKGTATLSVGQKMTLRTKVSVKPQTATTKKLVFESQNKAVATVSAKGVVIAKKKGTTKIVVRSAINKNKRAVVSVKVCNKVSSISLNYTELTLAELSEDEIQLVAKVAPSDANSEIEWTSSDEDVVDIDDEGYVFANTEGTAVIKAKATDGSGKFAICKVTVLGSDEDDDDEEDE